MPLKRRLPGKRSDITVLRHWYLVVRVAAQARDAEQAAAIAKGGYIRKIPWVPEVIPIATVLKRCGGGCRDWATRYALSHAFNDDLDQQDADYRESVLLAQSPNV